MIGEDDQNSEILPNDQEILTHQGSGGVPVMISDLALGAVSFSGQGAPVSFSMGRLVVEVGKKEPGCDDSFHSSGLLILYISSCGLGRVITSPP